MEYQEFIEYVKDNTLYLTGEGGTATINHVIKNNGCELDGLVLMEKDNDIAPTIYLNRLYEEYKKGKDIDDIDVYIGSERKVCPKCGAEVEEKDLFCINCGENLVQQGENKSENICPNCGEILEGHPEYCTRCGMRLIIKN